MCFTEDFNLFIRTNESFYRMTKMNYRMAKMKHFSLDSDLTRNYISGTIPPRLAQLPNLKIL
jgi:hypothetical protein